MDIKLMFVYRYKVLYQQSYDFFSNPAKELFPFIRSITLSIISF